MAASTPVRASSASVWDSVAILGGLPKIAGRGGDKDLEGPDSVEVVLLLEIGSGAALSIEGASLMTVGAAGVAEGASVVLVVLAIVGAAGAAPVVSGVPPSLGGSVVPGAVAAPAAGGASADAWSSSSPAACSGVAGMAVDVGLGPGVVWLVFLFFLLFFSSFFSSASLKRRGKKEVRRKVSQGLRVLQEYSRDVALHPPSLAWEGRGWWWGRRGLVGQLLAMGSPRLGSPAGAFIIELGAALCLQAGLALLLLQVSRGRRARVSPGGLVRQGRFVVGGI
jgi:hypothetical protein